MNWPVSPEYRLFTWRMCSSVKSASRFIVMCCVHGLQLVVRQIFPGSVGNAIASRIPFRAPGQRRLRFKKRDHTLAIQAIQESGAHEVEVEVEVVKRAFRLECQEVQLPKERDEEKAKYV